MKVIALYLPQFHIIPENNKWWGEGFTEWTNVKSAKPLFEGHKQPKIPLNENYYNLLDDNVKIWQANLAKKYGIYGFCYYHYWYNGKMLLEKPMEQMLNNKNIDIPFCAMWCNQAWTKSWVGKDTEILISQKSGDRAEWIEHYNYLRKFFLDKRYILNNNKPLFGIYNPEILDNLQEMFDCWNHLAKQDGFDGIDYLCLVTDYSRVIEEKEIYDKFDHFIESCFMLAYYKINYSKRNKIQLFIDKLKEDINKKYERIFGHESRFINNLINLKRSLKRNNTVTKFDYDEFWENILSLEPFSEKSILCSLVNWDNTARYGEKGSVMINDSVEKFEHYFSKQISLVKEKYKTDILFLQAWNEWAEWSVLEPDKDNGYGYLEAVKKALIANGEFN